MLSHQWIFTYSDHYSLTFAFSDFLLRHAYGMPCGYPSCHSSLRTLCSMHTTLTYSGYPVVCKWINVWLRFALYSGGIICSCYAIAPTSITLPLDILSWACHFPFWLNSFYEAFSKHSITLTISYYLSPSTDLRNIGGVISLTSLVTLTLASRAVIRNIVPEASTENGCTILQLLW